MGLPIMLWCQFLRHLWNKIWEADMSSLVLQSPQNMVTNCIKGTTQTFWVRGPHPIFYKLHEILQVFQHDPHRLKNQPVHDIYNTCKNTFFLSKISVTQNLRRIMSNLCITCQMPVLLNTENKVSVNDYN